MYSNCAAIQATVITSLDKSYATVITSLDSATNCTDKAAFSVLLNQFNEPLS